MNEKINIDIQGERIAEFCKRYHIRKLSFFGSVLRSDFSPDSDIDVLVEFESGKSPGFLGLAHIEREFSEILEGRKIDIRTPQELSRYFRKEVISSAIIQYAEG